MLVNEMKIGSEMLLLFFLFFGFHYLINGEIYLEMMINKLYNVYKRVSSTEAELIVKKVENKYEEKYEEKYLDRYKKIESVELSKEKTDSLKQSILFENTPLGNVLMFYDHSRETFVYYSDHAVPYRFLESVGRKYVITNNCKFLFVDMNEEIYKSTQESEKVVTQETVKETKSVFAKLKNYKNTESTSKKEKPVNIKVRANRYSHEGKLANFSFLKKVDRKAVDKNYSVSFAEFKKMNIK